MTGWSADATVLSESGGSAVSAEVMDSLWALPAGTARTWFADSPRRIEVMGGAGGLAMIGIGASLAVTGRKD